MTTLKYVRAEDLPAPGGTDVGPADLSPLLGTWFNTNPDTRHIIKLDYPPYRRCIYGAGLRRLLAFTVLTGEKSRRNLS